MQYTELIVTLVGLCVIFQINDVIKTSLAIHDERKSINSTSNDHQAITLFFRTVTIFNFDVILPVLVSMLMLIIVS